MSVIGERVGARLRLVIEQMLTRANLGGYRFILVESKLAEKTMYETEAAHSQESRTHFKVKFDPSKVEKRTDDDLVTDMFHELIHVMVWRFTNDIRDAILPYVPPDRYRQLDEELRKREEEFCYSMEPVGLALMGRADPVITIQTT